VSYFLGIDGGGTKTECLIGDEENVLGRGIGSTIKIRKVGADLAAQTLEMAIQAACNEAGIAPNQLAGTCIGLAGSSIPEVSDWAYSVLNQLVTGEVSVVNDALIAHRAAFRGKPGVLVIAGTGSNVLGIDENGKMARAGGGGPIISDEGSGFWIGRTTVAQGMRAHDLGRPTQLLHAVMQAWKLSVLEEVVSMANSNPPPDFASLLPEILRCANSGDVLAQEILTAAGNELAQLALIVIRKLWPDRKNAAVAVTGGVFAHSPQIRDTFASSIHAEAPAIAVNLEPVHPVKGALDMARGLAVSAKG
jgi:N-acetylglucosamine kinase-like BadF-type ATPase